MTKKTGHQNQEVMFKPNHNPKKIMVKMRREMMIMYLDQKKRQKKEQSLNSLYKRVSMMVNHNPEMYLSQRKDKRNLSNVINAKIF